MWTDGRNAGNQGQLKYFKAANLKYAFDIFRSQARRYLRAGHSIAFTLSTGNYPYRQVLVASEPMDSPHVQSIIGWFARVRFMPLPVTKDEKKYYTMIFKNIDTNKTTTENFDMALGDKAIIEKWKKNLQTHKNRAGGILVNGGGIVKQFAYTSTRKGVNSRHHPSDVLLAQWAQKMGMYKNFKLTDKAVGIYSVKEFNAEMKKTQAYKSAYKKRMIAHARQILIERAKM